MVSKSSSQVATSRESRRSGCRPVRRVVTTLRRRAEPPQRSQHAPLPSQHAPLPPSQHAPRSQCVSPCRSLARGRLFQSPRPSRVLSVLPFSFAVERHLSAGHITQISVYRRRLVAPVPHIRSSGGTQSIADPDFEYGFKLSSGFWWGLGGKVPSK